MRDRWRRFLSHFIVALSAGAVLLALIPLAFVLFYVVTQGISSLNVAFFTHMPTPVGEPGGGMVNSIVGSLLVTGMGAIVAIPVGLTAGIYAAEFRGTWLAAATRFAADTLNGVPSIVIGVFAYAVIVLPFHQFSAIAGALALAIMMLPLIMRTTEELLLLVPQTLREGALALGATQARAVFTVVVPAALPGILHGHPARARARGGRNRAAAIHGVQQSILLYRSTAADFHADRPGVHVRHIGVRRLAPPGMGRRAGASHHRPHLFAARASRHGANGEDAARNVRRPPRRVPQHGRDRTLTGI